MLGQINPHHNHANRPAIGMNNPRIGEVKAPPFARLSRKHRVFGTLRIDK